MNTFRRFMKSAGLTDVGFWSRFWSRFSWNPDLSRGDTAYPFGSSTDETGETVTPTNSLRLSSMMGCVSLRSDTVASLPLHVMNANKRLAKSHPLYDLLHSMPNADMTTSEWLAMTLVGLDLWGNSYDVIKRNSQRIVSLEPLNPEFVKVKRERGRLKYRFTPGNGEDEIVYDEDEILHFRGFSFDGIVGVSPIQYAAETIGFQMAANKAAAREFRTGMKAGGFLDMPDGITLDDGPRERLRDSLDKFSRPENAGKFMLLEAGVKVSSAKGIRINPVDAQLLESRGFGIEEICRAYRVPPPLIGHTDKASSWASSLSGLNQGFLTYCIRPILVRMEQRLERRCLDAGDRSVGVNIRFNFKGLQRGSFAEQMAGYVQGLSNGIYSIDDVLDLEDMPALPDGLGQDHRVPMNTEALGEEPEPAPAPPPAALPAPAAPVPPAPPAAPVPAKMLADLEALRREVSELRRGGILHRRIPHDAQS